LNRWVALSVLWNCRNVILVTTISFLMLYWWYFLALVMLKFCLWRHDDYLDELGSVCCTHYALIEKNQIDVCDMWLLHSPWFGYVLHDALSLYLYVPNYLCKLTMLIIYIFY
jgi:hypothetical protein